MEKYHSIEQYMSERLGTKSKSFFKETSPFDEMTFRTWILAKNNYENFQLDIVGARVEDSKLENIVKEFYESTGYFFKTKDIDEFVVSKDEESMLVYISNYGKYILVSVSPIPHLISSER